MSGDCPGAMSLRSYIGLGIARGSPMSKNRTGDLDDIIIVGSSIAMPKISKMLQEVFEHRPYEDVDTNEAVAIG
jgi:molecular chaperone DnaK (HSP70)